MGITPPDTLQQQWQQGTLTDEQAIKQLAQHIAQLSRELDQLQTAHHQLHLEVKHLCEGGSHDQPPTD